MQICWFVRRHIPRLLRAKARLAELCLRVVALAALVLIHYNVWVYICLSRYGAITCLHSNRTMRRFQNIRRGERRTPGYMPSRLFRRHHQQMKNTIQKQQQRIRIGMTTSSKMAHQGNPAVATAAPVAQTAAHVTRTSLTLTRTVCLDGTMEK